MSQDNYRPDEGDIRYILTEDNIPYEIEPGYARRVGYKKPLSDEDRMMRMTFILSGSCDISKEEAERIAERDNG
jgi:hypothetical protein